jgi:hypothetical protein
MKKYKIKSPSNKIFEVLADSIYHAIQICVSAENYKYSNINYIKL